MNNDYYSIRIREEENSSCLSLSWFQSVKSVVILIIVGGAVGSKILRRILD